MRGGVRPPGARPQTGPRSRPLLILAQSWEGPPAAPILALFTLRTPIFQFAKPAKIYC